MSKFVSTYFQKTPSRSIWLGWAIAITFFAILPACSGDQVEVGNLGTVVLEDPVGVERAQNVELRYSDSAIVRVIIHAPTLLRYIARDTPKQTFPDGVDADFYNEYQQQTSKLVADYAEQFQREQRVYLRKNVKLWNNEGEMLEAKELVWDKLGERISSTDSVRIITPTQIINGVGFTSNLDFTEREIYKVTGMVEQETMVETPF